MDTSAQPILGMADSNVVAAAMVDHDNAAESIVILAPATKFPCSDDHSKGCRGQASARTALVRSPVDPGTLVGLHGIWYCNSVPSAVSFDWSEGVVSATSTLTQLRVLGACSDATPVPNTQLIWDLGGDLGLFGVVDGVPFTSPADGDVPYLWSTLPGLTWPLQGGGLIFDEDGGGPNQFHGVVLMPQSSPDPGALYCFTTLAQGPDDGAPFNGLARLGSCADVENQPVIGALDVCLTAPPVP